MDKALLQKSTNLADNRKRRRHWQRAVGFLSVLVVLLTAYVLILPAITMEKSPICGMEAHTHGEDCYLTMPVYEYICPEQTKTLLHTHNEFCVDQWGNLLCSLPQCAEHIHGEDCYGEDGTLLCTIDQIGEHIHDAACFDDQGNLICTILPAVRHDHSEACRILSQETTRVLICTKEEHSHTDACFTSQETESAYLCGCAEHTHGEACFDEGGNLICTVPEHIHEAACLVSDLDLTANMESRQQWEETLADISLTGNYAMDLLSVANSQLGYRESDVNVILEDGKLKGITRYGQWYGSSYGDWCAMFVSFCLHYAGIEGVPLGAYCPAWIQELENAGLYHRAGDYTPKAGDLVFFDWDLRRGIQEETAVAADHVGIVEMVISSSEEESGKIVTIEGNSANAVSQVTYELTDPAIIGYAAMPEAEAYVVSDTILNMTSASAVDFNTVKTGGTQYILYTRYGGDYYAIYAKPGDAAGYAFPVTVHDDGTITWEEADNRLFWAFSKGSSTGSNYYVQNFATGRYLHAFDNSTSTRSDYGTLTGGRNDSTLTRQSDGSFIARGNGKYTGLVVGSDGEITFNQVSSRSQAAKFYLGLVGEFYNVWFDGTCGGMMSYYGAGNLNYPAVKNADGSAVTITLPETWKCADKYPYKLQGWYDLYSHIYYPVDPEDGVDVTAQITSDTVFYGDWIAESYDMGLDTEQAVESVDTSDSITTYVFDYNVLFNVLSTSHTGSVSAASHTETWSMVKNGKVPYENRDSLNFVFVDYDSGGDISYANGRDGDNVNHGDEITQGILQRVFDRSGEDLLQVLFDPEQQVIGKYYAGTGNYLFQYMDASMENYDGVHNGYYYLDARLNAASYNQSLQRFYVYDYLERTSDSRKDGGVGAYSDFLPFNAPYMFEKEQLDTYTDTQNRQGFEYDAKDGANGYQDYNSVDDAATNYFFGIRTDIAFYLPNDAGTQNEYGNYGNLSTQGEHMAFDFNGDDDVWVLVDGELLLDIGGIHGIMYGQIDFSTGIVTSGKEGGALKTQTFQEILGKNITEGNHTMTICYLERGSSQSNSAIYFNIAPRYELEITKEDNFTVEKLNGAVFSVYTDEALTEPAALWESEEAYSLDLEDGRIDNATNVFTVIDGKARCWGLSAGNTYYIAETTPPPGYPEIDDIIRLTLNNRGTATLETTILQGPDGEQTEGFAVLHQSVNDTLKIVSLTVTNQEDMAFTQVRVEKTWAEGSLEIPGSITVYLTADGVPVGRAATLYEGNGWSYTWTGLPKYQEEKEVVYGVQEVMVPGYATTFGSLDIVEDYMDWVRSDQMRARKTTLLVHNGKALTCTAEGFGWMEPSLAEQEESPEAQWQISTDHDGFRLENGLGYVLTFDAEQGRFYGAKSGTAEGNQVFYYLNSRLVVYDHDVYYQFAAGGAAVSSDGLVFSLYQKETLTGALIRIINVPVEKENQTFVRVQKLWSDGNENHLEDSVTFRLYADGKDTGRTLVLDAASDWAGGFYELPYCQEDGITKVAYTVEEDPFSGYKPFYEGPEALTPVSEKIWEETDTLEESGTYRFTSGSTAMGVSDDDEVVPMEMDPEDLCQQWKAVTVNGSLMLQNVGSGRFLSVRDSALAVTEDAGTPVTVSQGKIMVGSVYLEIKPGYVGVTANAANITDQKISALTILYGMPGTGFTVTNAPERYMLPNTGGKDSLLPALGGLLMAVTLMCIHLFGRKRQKGGR